ncbi:MAG: conjugal transfer protein TraA [Gammaproteobacteria bacterium]|nr:MAG: conjugal transfer protein TraA [Gammaproteobacteria bacterium]
MAIFFLQISSVTRSAGRRATAAAAYRAGERIRDERSGELINCGRRRDVLHTEIILPRQFDGMPVPWARDRQRLWNTAEHAEKRYNARVAREYQLSLPAELDAGRRIALARTFARDVAERYKVAVDLAVHEPRPDGDPRNFHAHLLTTTREVTPAGLGAKAGLDIPPLERRRRELPDHRQEYLTLRERWATLVNEALREANVAARVDHRSLAAQGVDREPLPRIPLMQLKMEQRGVRSELAERLRAEYRGRVQKRLAHSAGRSPRESAPGVARERAAQGEDQAPHPPAQIQDVEEIRRQAREAWLRLRPKEAERAGAERSAREREPFQPSRQAEDDLAL